LVLALGRDIAQILSALRLLRARTAPEGDAHVARAEADDPAILGDLEIAIPLGANGAGALGGDR
jgi:hypothetical protein